MPMQLWISKRRIDSISMLRDLFAHSSSDEIDARCNEIIGKISDGIFIPWLDRCEETCKKDRRIEGLRCSDMSCWRDVLLHEPDCKGLSDEAQRAIATVCGVPLEKIVAAVNKKGRADERAIVTIKKLKELVVAQSWYDEDMSARRTLENVCWSRVAIDSDTLKAVVSRLSKESTPMDIYVCNVGRPFILRQIDNFSNARLIGFGHPNVQFSASCRGKTFDMVEHNVKFVNIHLSCQGVLLLNDGDRCKNVDVNL